MPKLQGQITELFKQLLPEGVQLDVEVAPEWLRRPGRDEFGDGWSLVSEVYGSLTGLVLPEVAPPREHRRLDVVLTYPAGIRRVFEFDEVQHFTIARAQTLEYYADIAVAFDVNAWRNRVVALAGRERGGGWGVEKPPLFPESGGRHRQRAFRDFLADYLPSRRDGWLPTARIHDIEAKAALRSPSPAAALASLWNERTDESVGSIPVVRPETLPIESWWPLVNDAIRFRLMEATFSPLAPYSLGEIARVGGPTTDSGYWAREKNDPGAYLPSKAISWIAGQREQSGYRFDGGPDPRAAYFKRRWPRQ